MKKLKNDNLKNIIEFLKDKKISYTKLLDISEASSFADYFLIISMDNIKAVESIARDIEDFIAEKDIKLKSIEGKGTPWILFDCYDFIIHIFREEDREYYNIEKIWADCETIEI